MVKFLQFDEREGIQTACTKGCLILNIINTILNITIDYYHNQ